MTSSTAEPTVSRTTTDDGASALRFEMRFAFPPAVLWKHLTDPGKLKYWFPAEMDILPRKGTEVRFSLKGQRPLRGTVLEAEKPSLLAFTWDKETLRWELERDDAKGCRMVLSVTVPDASRFATTAAGWHLTLAGLDDYLNERSLGQDPALWEVYVDRYRKQLSA
ncbi:SRPBCC domain-containing protein [Arthrobacter sp. TMN-37]